MLAKRIKQTKQFSAYLPYIITYALLPALQVIN